MKVAYARPAKDEVYLIGRNEARRSVRSYFPDLELLAFQTMHGPKMSREVPYLATFAWSYIRVLSIRQEFVSEDLKAKFRTHVLPHCAMAANRIRDDVVRWPQVIVAIDCEIHQVSCSEGWLFPSLDEIFSRIKRNPQPICRYTFGNETSSVAQP